MPRFKMLSFISIMIFTVSLLSAILLSQANGVFPEGLRIDDRLTASDSKCKCYEGDICWPSAAAWNLLNTTVGGLLQKVIPEGAVCYNEFEGKDTYNASACSIATANWNLQSFQ